MKLLFLISTAILLNESQASLRSASQRKLSLGLIAGFEPSSVVTDHNALDLDQKAMEEQLDLRTDVGFAAALRIYQEGGYSKSYAVLTLKTALSAPIAIDTKLEGSDSAGNVVSGEAYEATETGDTTIKFRYAVGSSQESYTNCHVGGLLVTNTVGCLQANGTISAGTTASIEYSYDVESDNDNGRTLQGFSTNADKKMRHDEDLSKPYFPDYQKFFNYYGAIDYADQLVKAGFAGTPVTLSGKTFDFSSYDLAPRAEVVAKTTAYMNVAMYTIRELEDAIDDCLVGDATRNLDAVEALDEAVAFYTGSLEGTDGSANDGVFMYSLAEKRCANFKTCGVNGDLTTGNAKVNIDIFEHFRSMQKNLNNKDCEAARKNKEFIAQKMFVPIIQGTLRYAWKQSQPGSDDIGEAEGAIFAAAVLPVVASCNADAATTVYDAMKPNAGTPPNFGNVKSAFESTYQCMGISCADVGGLYDIDNNQYYDGANPCGSSKSSSSKNTGLIVGLTIGGVVLVAALALFTRSRRSGSQVEFKGSATPHV